MRKTTACALFLLLGMFSLIFPKASMAITGSNEKTSTSSSNYRPIDSTGYRQALAIIQNKVPLTYNETVQRYIDLYLNSQKARFARVLGLAKYYFPIYDKVFKARNVPEDLKYISVIESSLNPNAVSKVGATGLWQFMYGTAKIYGLTIDNWVDERKDAAKACNAAASYLLDSYFLYDDWLLAIASFNCGRNNIRWAIQQSGGKKDFWSIRPYLPAETQNYVPAFIATAYIMNNYWKHNIVPLDPGFTTNTQVVSVKTSLSLQAIAQAANVKVEELTALNPFYKKPIINGSIDNPKELILPVMQGNPLSGELYTLLNGGKSENPQVLNARAATDDTRLVTHRVREGESLPNIANLYRVEVQDIKAWNKLKSTALAPGQVLKIYTSAI